MIILSIYLFYSNFKLYINHELSQWNSILEDNQAAFFEGNELEYNRDYSYSMKCK